MAVLKYCTECRCEKIHEDNICVKCGTLNTYNTYIDHITKQDEIIEELNKALQQTGFILTTIDFLNNYKTSHIYN